MMRIKTENFTLEYVLLKRNLTVLLNSIENRCSYPHHAKYKYYGGKGIKNYLTIFDLIYMWNRDKAQTMSQPSIDRRDSTKDYTLSNCQFLEMRENRVKRWANREENALAANKMVKLGIEKYGGKVELAHALGVSYWTIQRWVHGKTAPKDMYLKKLQESINGE